MLRGLLRAFRSSPGLRRALGSSAWSLRFVVPACVLLAAAASAVSAAPDRGIASAAPDRGIASATQGRAPPPLVIVLDPGHGGDRDGAVTASGVREKDLTLQIARRIAALVRARGARVVLTRTGDSPVPLAQRAAIANAERADVFLSIHLNAMPGRARDVTHGIETYFLSADATDASATAVAARENADRLAGEPEVDPADPVSGILEDLANTSTLAESSDLAYALHDALVASTGAADRGVKQAPFYVLAGARMPAVLVEVGFLSHPSEARRLASAAYQEQVARAIVAGIDAWRAREATGG